MTVIEVQAIRPPRAARSPGHVIGIDGASFECWPEKLGKLQVGQRYAVEIEEREWQGRPIRKIVKAQPADRQVSRQVGGKPGQADQVSRQVAAKPAPADPVQTFAVAVLCAFISAGKVGLDADEIAAAIDTVRAGCRRARQINGGGNAQH
jgi:hypothetical protein